MKKSTKNMLTKVGGTALNSTIAISNSVAIICTANLIYSAIKKGCSK